MSDATMSWRFDRGCHSWLTAPAILIVCHYKTSSSPSSLPLFILRSTQDPPVSSTTACFCFDKTILTLRVLYIHLVPTTLQSAIPYILERCRPTPASSASSSSTTRSTNPQAPNPTSTFFTNTNSNLPRRAPILSLIAPTIKASMALVSAFSFAPKSYPIAAFP